MQSDRIRRRRMVVDRQTCSGSVGAAAGAAARDSGKLTNIYGSAKPEAINAGRAIPDRVKASGIDPGPNPSVTITFRP